MASKVVDEIKKRLEERSSEELIAIWTKNDKSEWSDDAFEAVHQILTERKIAIPQQSCAVGDANRAVLDSSLTDKQLSLIVELHKKTGLPFEECRDAVLSSQGDGDKLSKLIEQKAQAKNGPQISLTTLAWFIFARIFYHTLKFGFVILTVCAIVGIGFKGVTFSQILGNLPFIFGFSFIVAVFPVVDDLKKFIKF